MIRWLRRAIAIALAALALRWLWAILEDRPPLVAAGYPNEWGVRTLPLGALETAAAIALERELAATMPPEVVPGVRIVQLGD